MARNYNFNWATKPLTLNFNLKQWRQDIGDFIRRKKFWDGTTRITRSKVIQSDVNSISKGIKQFKIYNAYGGEVIIQYQNYNEILYTNELELVNEYLKFRGKNE